MKRNIFIIVLALSCLLSGCASWMDGNYTSVTPHQVQNSNLPKESVEVQSYQELEQALTDLVEGYGTKSVFYTQWATEDSHAFMQTAAANTMRRSPLAAYAVEDIQYEVGTNAGKSAIAVEILYRYDRSEILRIKQAADTAEAQQIISAALESCDPNTVIHVEDYKDADLTQYIQDYVDSHPDTCMEMPQVSVAAYPESGFSRILSVSFTYQTSREALRSMQLTVEQMFSSAKLYVSEDAGNWEKVEQLYAFLMERFQYKIETSITPSYSLLRHGVGDSKAFATVYGAMCRQVGLDCTAISGTKDGVARYWNILQIDGITYHIDLLSCNESGEFQAMEASQMDGYVWDYSAVPQ